MPVIHLKQATKTPETETGNARRVAAEMLAKIERGGEQAVRDYAAKLDQWTGDIVVTDEEAERLLTLLRKERISIFYARVPAEFGAIEGDG